MMKVFRRSAFRRTATWLVAILFILLVASPLPAQAAQSTPIVPALATSASLANPLLQFTTQGHVVGFGRSEFHVTNAAYALHVQFVDAAPVAPKNIASKEASHHGAPPLRRVRYAGLWDGITLDYDAVNNGVMRSTYHLEPGADPADILLRYNAPISLNDDGALTIAYASGQMNESAPAAWQVVEGRHVSVPVAFTLHGDHELGFAVGNYDADQPLFIDPTLTWHTFLGGNGDDQGHAIAVDGSGNVYVSGQSGMTWGTPVRAHTAGNYDAFAAKLDASGALLWNTFLGANQDDYGAAIALDGSGNVYVGGYSGSTWGSPIRAYTSGYDAFAAKLDSSGALQWHTFLGASGNDLGRAIAVDSSGNVYVGGYGIATWGAPVRAFSGGNDTFAVKLNSSGVLQWNTFLGSSLADYGFAIAVDGSNNVYVGGNSASTWGSPVRAHGGGPYDGYVAKLNGSGGLQWHTFLGGSGEDQSRAMRVDASGNVYVGGFSAATWGTPVRTYSGGGWDAFAAKVNGSGVLQWHTFLGGGGIEQVHAVAVDESGNVYVGGQSSTTWGTPESAFNGGSYDALIAKMDDSGVLQWHTFLGGSGTDLTQALAVGASSNIYVGGHSTATWGAPLRAYSVSNDVFAVKMSDVPPSPSLSIPNNPIDASNGSFSVPVNFVANGNNIASVGFSIDYDEACLVFDATDGDNDDIPDAISGLPAGFIPSIAHDANDASSELDISLFDNTVPLSTLSDGALFTVAFNVKPACITTDGSTTNVTVNFAATPAPSFSDTTANDVTGSTTDATITLSFNATPTALNLSNSSVDENAASGTTVGTLSTIDPDAGDTHVYTLVSGAGDTDNASFTIDGDALKTAAVFDFESKNSYAVRIRTTDNGGLNGTFEQSFTISVNDLNEIPTALTLGNASVDENAASGATVGTLSTSDPDAGDSHTYTFATGSGDADNASFALDNGVLKTAAIFNFEVKNSYTVRIRTTDSGNLFIEQSFIISVNDLNEAPVAVDDPNDPTTTVFLGGQATVIDVLANDTDEDGDTLSVTALTQPASGSVTNNTSNVSFTAPDVNGSGSFTYQTTDGALNSNTATVGVTYVKNDPRGDCNANGNVTAADFIATVLEIFDSNDTLYNSNPAWWLIYSGDFAGSPRGCDANASQNGVNHTSDSVTAGDIICTVLVFFGNSQCTGNGLLAASAQSTATLSVAAELSGAPGATVSIPLTLDTAGNAVAAATFALQFDPAALNFDASDGDGNGLPDGISFNTPAGMSISASYNADLSRLEVALFALSLPMPLLQDGSLATVQLQIDPAIAVDETPLTLDLVSLGDDQGRDVPVTSSNGVVVVTDAPTFDHLILLPLVAR